MKRLLVLMLTICMLTGCSHAGKHQSNQGENVPTKEVETKEPVATETVAPEPTKDIMEEETLEPTIEPEEMVVSDDSVVAGMADAILEGMTLEEKVGQLFLVNLEGLDSSKGSFYEHRKLSKEMKKKLMSTPVGGVIFFSRNIETREQTSKFISDLQANSEIPLFIAVDEEGGDVSRIASNPNMKTTSFPSMEEVGANETVEFAHDMGVTIGTQIKELGFNLDFAPVADVRTNERNTEIGNRSFGSNEKQVSSYVKAVVKGLQSVGVSSTLKHFPGHGDASGDTHIASVNVDNDLNRMRNVDFVPFKAGIKAGADFIMVSHISISRVAGNTTPASLSPLVMQTILRDELGFNGLIVTDAMDMKAITSNYTPKDAAVKAIKAGADIVLMPENFEEAYYGVLNAVMEGEISKSQINQSVTRVLKTKIKRGLILSDTNLIYK